MNRIQRIPSVEMTKFGDTVKSADTINHFVKVKTNGKIKDFVRENSLSTDSVPFILKSSRSGGVQNHS